MERVRGNLRRGLPWRRGPGVAHVKRETVPVMAGRSQQQEEDAG